MPEIPNVYQYGSGWRPRPPDSRDYLLGDFMLEMPRSRLLLPARRHRPDPLPPAGRPPRLCAVAGHRADGGQRVHGGVGVDVREPMVRAARVERVEVLGVVHAQQLLAGDFRRLVVAQQRIDAGRDQVVLDGRKAPRRLRVPGAGIVFAAVGVGDEGGVHGSAW